MKIALLSADNSHKVTTGGKHVHQNLLEKGLKTLSHTVETYYYDFNWKEKVRILLKYPHFKLLGKTKRFKIRFIEMANFFDKLDLKRYDVVHAHDVVSACEVEHPHLILTFHGYFARETVNYEDFADGEREEVYNFCLDAERKALKKAVFAIAVDSRIKKYLVEELGYPEEKIQVIYNATDTDTFSPVNEDEQKRIRRKLGLPEDKFIVFVPRRYVEKNGVTYAAQAFAEIKDNRFSFIFAGRGPLKANIERILGNNTNAFVLEPIPYPDIAQYYKASNVILIPSVTSDDIEEATSLSMLEGMACGKIVICTNIGGMAEVVKDGVNGLLIPQKDPEAIQSAVMYAYERWDELKSLRVRAREFVVKNHSYLEHSKKIVEVYKKVIEK